MTMSRSTEMNYYLSQTKLSFTVFSSKWKHSIYLAMPIDDYTKDGGPEADWHLLSVDQYTGRALLEFSIRTARHGTSRVLSSIGQYTGSTLFEFSIRTAIHGTTHALSSISVCDNYQKLQFRDQLMSKALDYESYHKIRWDFETTGGLCNYDKSVLAIVFISVLL